MRLRHWPGEILCVAFAPHANSTHLITWAAGEVLLAAQRGRLDPAGTDGSIVDALVGAGLLRSIKP